jgi:hypothetical protein
VDTQATLWAAILASGFYHGLNPGMGWPLAVAAGLTERRATAVVRTLGPLAAGHLVSVAVVLLPFGALAVLLDWTREIRIAAGLMIVSFSGVLLLYPRHPRWLVRMRPTQVSLWSFTVALLHGAGLMLVPMLLGLCAPSMASGPPVSSVAANGAAVALVVALAHTAALVAASGLIAWAVYRALGLEMLRRSWLDLRRLWAASLALVGALSVWSAV